MITRVSLYDFIEAFEKCDRHTSYTRLGLEALFNYLEQFEEDTGEQFELDVIALCCEFTESSVEEALECYDFSSLEELMDNTIVIEVDNGNIIYQQF